MFLKFSGILFFESFADKKMIPNKGGQQYKQ